MLGASVAARAGGVRAGVRVSAAHALVPHLRVQERDPRAEGAVLERLAAWAGQFTSLVSVAPPQSLLLEVAGSRACFGGLDSLIGRTRAGLQQLGFSLTSSCAPTPLSALWLAREGAEARIEEDYGALFRALAPLPLRVLGLDEKRQLLLQRMGLQCLSDCLRLPRDGLARRLGPEVVLALDRAFGRVPDPRAAFAPPAMFSESLPLPAPVSDAQALLFAIARLLRELTGFLGARGLGVQAFRLLLQHARCAPTQIDIALVAPTRATEHLLALVRSRLERVALPAAVEEVRLQARRLPPLAATALNFFSDAHSEAPARTELIERLQARLGKDAVRGLGLIADHRPECAYRFVTPGGDEKVMAPPVAPRPLWLLPQPIPLPTRADVPCCPGPLALASDGERIESGWWDGQRVRRDYFVARDGAGACLWIFRELNEGRWFLQGVFA